VQRGLPAPPLTPAKGHRTRPVGALLDQRLVVLPSGPRMDHGPAVLAIVLQTGHIRAEERGEFATATLTLALIAHLIVQDIGLHLHPLVNVAMLQLHKSGRDGRNVALLIREGHTASTLGILKLRIGVNPGIAHAAIQSIHDHGQLESLQRTWHSAYEHRLARIQRHGGI